MSADVDTIQVVVTIACDNLYRVKSSHRLLSPEDHATARLWPSGGQAQLAHGLLFEATRREAILSMLLMLQENENWLTCVHDMSEAERAKELKELATKVLSTLTRTLGLVVKDAVDQTYAEMLKPLERPIDA